MARFFFSHRGTDHFFVRASFGTVRKSKPQKLAANVERGVALNVHNIALLPVYFILTRERSSDSLNIGNDTYAKWFR